MSRQIAIFLAPAGALFMLLVILNSATFAEGRLGPRCIDVGPLSADYCGCTWGRVLFHGEPLVGVPVTLEYGGQLFSGTTQVNDVGPAADYAENPFPYFDLSAYDAGNGALHGDVITATAIVGGIVISRTYRALPDEIGLQNIDLVVPDAAWELYTADNYTSDLLIVDDILWAAGTAGVRTVDLSNGATTNRSTAPVYALAQGADGRVWSAGELGVYEFVSGGVQQHDPQIALPVTAIATDGSQVLVTNQTQLAEYDSGVVRSAASWMTLAKPNTNTIFDVSIDGSGAYWVSGDNGAFRHNGTGWDTFTVVNDGLASDKVVSAESTPTHVWIGTDPPSGGSSNGGNGGISQFDLATSSWKTYTQAHGLRASKSPFGSTIIVHDVYDITFDAAGNAWAAVENAVQFQPHSARWGAYTAADGLPGSPIHAVAVHESGGWAASADGLYRQNPALIAGTAPTATIVTATLAANTLTLHATAHDTDADDTIATWEWTVLETGEPLCSTMSCTVSAELLDLPPSSFTVALRVQDDEGMWSDVQMEEGLAYVPTVVGLGGISADDHISPTLFVAFLLLTLTILPHKRKTMPEKMSRKH